MKAKDQFSADMSKIFSLVHGECGGSDIQGLIFDYFNVDIDFCDSDNAEDWIESYRYNNRGVFHLLYSLANYDLISLHGKTVDVEASNHPDIAAIIKQYAKQETINKVHELLYE